MFDVVGIGRSCVDHLALLESVPAPDRKVPLLRYRMVGGGQAATALAALARLGLKVAYVGRVGDDAGGRMVLEGLKEAGVDVSGVVVEAGAVTPVALILVDGKTGLRTIAYLKGSEESLPEEALDLETILSARCLMIDPQGTLTGVAIGNRVREKGVPIIYDAEDRVEGLEEMLSLCDYVVGSSDVLEALGTGSVEEALKKLVSYGPRAAVITRGDRGSVALSPEGLIRKPAYPVRVVDTTAAGDAFHAGFAYSLLQRWGMGKSLEFSNALGALVCRGLGGRETLPTLEEVKALAGWDVVK